MEVAESEIKQVVHAAHDSARTSLSKLAYCKIFLHAAKYPYGPVAGFVIGRKIADNKFEMIDVLPVCHGYPAGPLFDVCVLLGDKMHSDREVIGLYFSSGLKDSDEAPRFVNRITKGILARSDSCVVVQLKSSQIHDPSKLAVGITNRGNAISFTMEDSVEVVGACVDGLLQKGCHHRLIDFEDHMDNKDADFRNVDLAQQMN